MAPNVRTLGRNLLVYMVTAVACIQSVAEAVVALVKSDMARFWIWLGAALAWLGSSVKRLKLFLEE